MKANRPIGIFDSGVGGLTVLREIEKILPHEDIIYFGDTARVPYGNKSKATVIKFSAESIHFLLGKRAKMVIVACNTSSSLALDYLTNNFSVPVIGVIEAGVKRALKATKGKKIGVIGTRSTIQSKSYEKAIHRKDRTVKVLSRACPLFVPLAEEGILSGEIVEEVIKMYLSTMKAKGIDAIILGCTHYPLLKRTIALYLKNTHIVDSAKEVALHAKEILRRYYLFNRNKKKGKVEFYVTDEPQGFLKLAKLFLKRQIPHPKVLHV
ncbi:MAG: glutamate racemase [Candidatus Omnitrophota bacterium]|nr:MAG: glutamate racemase [Candidatus Omnitrophota bacterium]